MTTPDLDPATETALAKRLFNEVWGLLDRTDRSPADDDRMIHAAHASRFHWEATGTTQNLAIGEWQVARVYSELGHSEPALYHSRRALQLINGVEVDQWMRASALEGLARASAVAGDRAAANDYARQAREALALVTDDGDRQVVQADLDTLP